LRYIGPFLRLNTLNKDCIGQQLFHLSKESLKFLALHSRFGIILTAKEYKFKNTPNIDINILNSISPLLCIYKKGSPNLINLEHCSTLSEDSFKKEIIVSSNGYMCLALLELTEYYSQFKELDNSKYSYSLLYLNLVKKQLDFFASYLRNEEGVFIDKKDITEVMHQDYELEPKDKKFKFSDQALLMTAYYRFAQLYDHKDKETFENFAMDIYSMFMHYKDHLYEQSSSELIKLCLAFNLFYKYSNFKDCRALVMDLNEYVLEYHSEILTGVKDEKVELLTMLYINFFLLYINTGLDKYRDFCCVVKSRLLEYYNPELGIFIKNQDKKEVSYSSFEIMSYIMTLLIHNNNLENTSEDHAVLIDVYKRQLIDSGIIKSWPDSPELEDRERYMNFSLKPDELIEDQYFRYTSLPTPEASEFAPLFLKNVIYNKKKEIFMESKTSFDSYSNMFIFFYSIFFFRKHKCLIRNVNDPCEEKTITSE